MIKGLKNLTALLAVTATLGACSSTIEIAERDSYAQPKWYASCLKQDPKGGSGGRKITCLLYTSPSPRDQRGSRMPSSA